MKNIFTTGGRCGNEDFEQEGTEEIEKTEQITGETEEIEERDDNDKMGDG